MIIRNETIWRTDHLKAILQKVAERELEPAKRKRVHVTVSYTRGAHSSGCAMVGGRHATVRIRHPYSRKAKYVQVPDSDPRREQGRWADGKGRSGKVVREAAPTALTPEQTTELVLHFAAVAAHEFAHLRGMEHNVMPNNYKWIGRWREYVAWIAGMPLAVKPAKTTVKPTVSDKLTHVLKMKALAETRVKRATTILRKWKARERYYLKAAQKASE